MAQRVYSVSFISAQSVTGEEVLTVPDGFTWVVRDAMVWSDAALASESVALLGGEGQLFYQFESGSTRNACLGQWQGRVVLEPGQQLSVLVFSGTWDVTVCGYQLTLP